jgi:hypothetical protein
MSTQANYIFVDDDGYGIIMVYDDDGDMPSREYCYDDAMEHQTAKMAACDHAKHWATKLGCEWGSNF